jgi:hypothetical protein
LRAGGISGSPEEIRAHGAANGAARILRDDEAIERLRRQRHRRRQEYRRAERHEARIDRNRVPGGQRGSERADGSAA